MSNLLYVGIAVVLSLLGWLVMWLRHRHPTSTEASVREFARELDALAPPNPANRRGRDDRDQDRSRRSG